MDEGLRAAVEVATSQGLRVRDAQVLEETRNTVVWLRPEPVVAKVATRHDAGDGVCREHALALELCEAEAEIARPLAGAGPMQHEATGFIVTFWEHVEGAARAELPPEVLALSLTRLHTALGKTDTSLPSYRESLDRARRALDDDEATASVAPPDRSFLRAVLDEVGDLPGGDRRLHGEPHDANRLVRGDRVLWIDFEAACVGPLEWDLAFQPSEVDERFEQADPDLLARLRRLNSARVATWCLSAAARFPDMQRHGDIHMALLRG